MIKNKSKIIIVAVLFCIGISLIWASLWQQEIVIIDTLAGRKFNFMGFGDFGLAWWTWRDIFYLWIIVALPPLIGAGYLIGTVRERRRKRPTT